MIEHLVPGGDAPAASLQEICGRCLEVVAASAAAVSIGPTGYSGAALAASDPLASAMEELQFVIGEGPSLDAYRKGRPVLAAEMAGKERRWPEFAPVARERGIGAVFAFPVQFGPDKLGVLSFYREYPGPLTSKELADSQGLSDAIACLLVVIQGHAPPASLARSIDELAEFWAVVHQATGMIAGQLEVDLDEALMRLRAYSFAQDNSITQVSEQVVTRELRFAP